MSQQKIVSSFNRLSTQLVRWTKAESEKSHGKDGAESFSFIPIALGDAHPKPNSDYQIFGDSLGNTMEGLDEVKFELTELVRYFTSKQDTRNVRKANQFLVAVKALQKEIVKAL